MQKSAHFYFSAPVFHGKQTPEEGIIVGYAAIIHKLKLQMPMVTPIALICDQNKKYQNNEWIVLPSSYIPEDNTNLNEIEAIYKHLVFALKYEGINLLFFSFLIEHYSEEDLTSLVSIEPTGQYSRRIWFIIEWLRKKELKGMEPLNKKSYVAVVDERHQYAIEGIKSRRQLVINNLPGTPDFCPLIKKTQKLEEYIKSNLSNENKKYLTGIRKEIIQRASSFLLLKDSKASFSIEGESPKSKRAFRWGQAIGQAGVNNLNEKELMRLQQVVIENSRFIEMGFRKKGGFVGEHDRITGEPIPDHISAKWQDLPNLMNGLITTNKLLGKSNIDPVIAATIIAFGFIFIHPFEDGNGRIHRYLIHHVLAKKKFSEQGIVFPISASILNHIDSYRQILESYSHKLLDFIEWEETNDHNISVLNDTINYYRYYDLTLQVEFLYDCVFDTIKHIIPDEFLYLTQYDLFKKNLDEAYEMPDKLVALLINFLGQNNGSLSKRARQKEFSLLTENEIESIEKLYKEIFIDHN
ncbi:Fic family protein [Corallibacter sp.]|uniref:Fic family protein n=1 Tax=Corallibacter sp. TaxID=2038084 RepID=UPI003AB7D676